MTMSMANGSNRIAQRVSRNLVTITVVAAGLFLLAPTPVRAGTILNQVSKFLASDGATGDQLGESIAVSGATAVVGAWLDDDNGNTSGSAYVFNLQPADLNSDGVVDGVDLAMLLNNLG